MMNACAPARAFDLIADSYDATFTESVIGRAQRNAVWRELQQAFTPGDRVLEINCGTGVDALMLAQRGIAVEACDVSPRMIAVAEQRRARESEGLPVNFRVLAAEDLHELEGTYDGAFSNFGGLNCVPDLRCVAVELGRMVRPGGSLVICLAGRICAWELLWYGVRGRFRRATRRWKGQADGKLREGYSVPVFYPTSKQLARALSPWFRLVQRRGIGVVVPPSYAQDSLLGRPAFVRFAERCDRFLGETPGIRAAADHALFVFERTRA